MAEIDITRELNDMKKVIDRKTKDRDRIDWEIDESMKQLEDEGLSSTEAAEDEVANLTDQIATEDVVLLSNVQALRERYDWNS